MILKLGGGWGKGFHLLVGVDGKGEFAELFLDLFHRGGLPDVQNGVQVSLCAETCVILGVAIFIPRSLVCHFSLFYI